MRRNFTLKEALATFLIAAAITTYEALSDIYFYLPPLFGVAFIIFIELAKKEKYLRIIPLVLFLLLYESGKGFLFLSSLFFFTLSYLYVIPAFEKLFDCRKCLIPVYVFYAYLGFYLFNMLLSLFIEEGAPPFSMLYLYYGVIESLFLVLLL